MKALKNKFIISLGSNLGDRLDNLKKAKAYLSSKFKYVEESQIVESQAVDYLDQPNFLNQCICYANIKNLSAHEVLTSCLETENNMGRKRLISKGPRVIDIDLLFFDSFECKDEHLTLPHPRLFNRSFIVKPLSKLKVFNDLQTAYEFKNQFENSCWDFEG